jgi:O-antigen ligase
MRLFAITAMVVLVLAVVLPDVSVDREGLTVPWLHPAWSGLYMGVGGILCVGRGWQRAPNPIGSHRWWYLAAGALFAGAVATLTRSVMAAILVGMVVLWRTYPEQRRLGTRQLAVAGMGVAAVAAVFAFATQIGEFLARDQDVETLASFSDRNKIFAASWRFILESPLIGNGFNASRSLFFDATDIGFIVDGAHNDLVEATLSGGVVGLGLFVALVVSVVSGLWRFTRPDVPTATRREASVLLSVVAALLVVGSMFEGMAQGSNASAVWLALAAMWLTRAEADLWSSRLGPIRA